MSRLLGALALALLLNAPNVSAQAHLVKDVRAQASPAGSAVQPMATVGNTTYFAATLPASGIELWKSDGTAAGTQLVRDICPGTCSSLAQHVPFGTALGNRLIFPAVDDVHGAELWSSDGTASGTVMLADVTPGSGSGIPATFIFVAGSLVYFDGVSPTVGRELWVSDGTPAGTHLVTDLNPGTGTSFPTAMGSFGSQLLFRAFDGTTNGLFLSDGTQQGTHFVTGLTPTRGITLGNTVMMTVHETDGSWSLWKSDGTAAGTALVHGGYKAAPDQLTVAGGLMYFTADDGIHGSEIWRTDGTAGGTSLLLDLTPGSAGSNVALRRFGNTLVFIASTSSGTQQLWISDGSPAGTRMLKELLGISSVSMSGPRYLFGGRDADHGWELWTTDGTAQGTQLVTDIAPGTASGLTTSPFMTARPDGVFFAGDDGVHGIEPWVSDGTAAGTRMAKDVQPETQLGSNPSTFVASGGRLLFGATDASAGIWASDGTATGTVLLASLPSLPVAAAASAGVGYFATSFPSELWRSDGTSAGTYRLYSAGTYSVSGFAPLKNGMFFITHDTDHDYEPWVSDGTAAGTHILADLAPGTSTSYPDWPASAGDYVYFSANHQPYRTDGTAAGTKQITTVLGASESEQPQAFTQVGGSVYFAAYLQDHAFNLWRTDTATTQAVLVHRFVSRAPSGMWSAGGGVMFFTDGALWRSDGTDAGTVKLADHVKDDCFQANDTAAGDGILYWYNFANISSPELWRSDGTVPGTFKVASFGASYANSLQSCTARSMTYAGGHLYFIGSDALYGEEPWISDGTVAGTHLLADVNPGSADSSPGPFLKIGPTLYFAASNPAVGRELWAITDGVRRRAVAH